jgi:hypothetical protein
MQRNRHHQVPQYCTNTSWIELFFGLLLWNHVHWPPWHYVLWWHPYGQGVIFVYLIDLWLTHQWSSNVQSCALEPLRAIEDLDFHLGEVRHKVCNLQLLILAKTTSINNSISIIIVHASTKLTRGGNSKLSLRSYVNGHLLSSKIKFCSKLQHPYMYCMFPQR